MTARVQSVPHMQRSRPNASKTRPQQPGPDWTGLGSRNRHSSASQVRALARCRKTYRREFPCSVLIPPYRAATPQSTPIIPAKLTYSPRARGRRGAVQRRERFRILRAHWRILATGIGPLQRAEHGKRDRDRRASMVLFAHHVELCLRFLVTIEAVHAQAVVDVGKAAAEDLRAVPATSPSRLST